MQKRPAGIVLLAGALLLASLVGLLVFWQVLPRNANTSPLFALSALLWSSVYFVSATLTWRRSRFAPLALVAAISLLLFPASFIVPGGQLLLPASVVLGLLAWLGYRYLRRSDVGSGQSRS